MPNRRIYKYEINDTVVTMPRGARVISAAEQCGRIVVYAVINIFAPLEHRMIAVIPTGDAPPPDYPALAEFIGTVQRSDGTVWHLFDLGEA
jgi:hypothetical protein